jgi:hypothetical protein
MENEGQFWEAANENDFWVFAIPKRQGRVSNDHQTLRLHRHFWYALRYF